jgi:hypothetical protein
MRRHPVGKRRQPTDIDAGKCKAGLDDFSVLISADASRRR